MYIPYLFAVWASRRDSGTGAGGPVAHIGHGHHVQWSVGGRLSATALLGCWGEEREISKRNSSLERSCLLSSMVF